MSADPAPTGAPSAVAAAGIVLAVTLVAAVSAVLLGPPGPIVVGVLAAVATYVALTRRPSPPQVPAAATDATPVRTATSTAAPSSASPSVASPSVASPSLASPSAASASVVAGRPSPAAAGTTSSGPVRSRDRDVATFLGRRGQSLVARQLELLGVATVEPYPEELVRLALRLRRNAESLLISSGAEPPQRWSRPVAALDAAKIAGGDSEVGDRVRFDVFPETWISPSTVGAVIHVLAELLDHAARSSPPDAVVVVSASFDPGRDLVILVSDQGMGLGRDELDRANLLLAGDEPSGGVTAVGLGHLLAGRLAARTGLVATMDSAGHGLVATLRVPASAIEVAPRPGSTTGTPRRRGATPRAAAATAVGAEDGGTSDRTAARWTQPASSRPTSPASSGSSATPSRSPVTGRAAAREATADATTTTGLQRRVPGASRGGEAGDAPIGAFRRKRGRGAGADVSNGNGNGNGELAGEVEVERSAAARRQRLDGFSAGRATAEAVMDSDEDASAGAAEGDEERA